MSERNTLLESVLVIFSGTLAIRLVKIGFTPVLVRIIGQAQFGIFASVMAAFGVVSLVSNAGLFDSVRKHVAELQSESGEERILVADSVVLASTYGLVGTVVMVTLTRLPLGFGQESSAYLLLLALAVIPKNLFGVFRGAFYGRQQEQRVEPLQVMRELVYAVVGLTLAANGFGLIGVFFGYMFAVYASTAVAGFMTYSNFNGSELDRFEDIGRYSRKVARYGGAQAVGGIAAMLLYQADVLLVNYFGSSTETALYKAALIPAQFIWIVPTVIQIALLQNASSHWSNRRIDAITSNVRTGLRYAFLALSLFGIGLFALADEFLAVYFGSGYGGSTLPLQILIVGSFFFGLNRILNPVLQSTGWIVHTQSVGVLGLLANIILNVLFIPRYGIVGAALATAISYVMIFLGNLFVWRSTEFGYLKPRTIVSLVGTFSLFAVVYVPLVDAVAIGTMSSLLVFPPVGGLLFFVLCVRTGVIRGAELTLLRSRVARVLDRE